jgi:hypothetical protein
VHDNARPYASGDSRHITAFIGMHVSCLASIKAAVLRKILCDVRNPSGVLVLS